MQKIMMLWIDLSLHQLFRILNGAKAGVGRGKEDTYAPSVQQDEEKAAAVPSLYSSEGKAVFGCTPNNIAAQSLPLWASTEMSLVQELKWSARQSPGTWLRAPFESDEAAKRRAGKCLCSLRASICSYSKNE